MVVGLLEIKSKYFQDYDEGEITLFSDFSPILLEFMRLIYR